VVKQVEGELLLRRPDGRIVEIVVVAAHRGATTLRSRWLAALCSRKLRYSESRSKAQRSRPRKCSAPVNRGSCLARRGG